MDPLWWQPELFGDHLCISGLMTLPARLGADQNRDVTIGIESHIGGLLAHGAPNLDIGRKPDAANETLLFRGLGALGEFPPVGNFHRPLHMRREFAGIVDLAGGGLVRHCPRRDKSLAPDRIRSHSELTC